MSNEKTSKAKSKGTAKSAGQLRQSSEEQNAYDAQGQKEVKHPGGRPTDYTPELATRICEELIKPRPLIDICNDEDMPDKATVYRWLAAHQEFRDKYRSARETQADIYVEEIIKIADTADADNVCDEYGNIKPNHEWIARSKLRVDARKWYASKVAPKKYGDKIEQTVVGDPERPQQHNHTIDVKKMTEDQLKDFIRKQTHGE